MRRQSGSADAHGLDVDEEGRIQSCGDDWDE